ncbi:hypothetical protein [Rugosimonospora africana]|uniref:Uncharacterized protein n=1 Tax=Rugosimonospora africana TaxID=556532 RepID=A0A8J3QV14_9ACTN|nr:hypothetical protein [Rugosimonospora africana]GIH16949.1 hypothetical protein Raf01_51210 [Rugosimonospora africana]
MTDARQWIHGLGPELAVQARLLDRLLTAVEADARWEWLELGCSVAEGRGDELSDLDVGLGHIGDDSPPIDDVTNMLRGFGDVVDLSAQPWDGVHRWWVQYADGGQIDLVVLPAAIRSGKAPRSVALLDRRGRLATTFTPRKWAAAPDDPHRWLLDGWEALSNVAKYLRRASLLEGIEQIHRGRTRVLQLWAVGEGVPYPEFGLTSLLDDADAQLPPDIEATYPSPDPAGVLSAALATATLLYRAGHHAQPELDTPLRHFVTTRLQTLNA